jgi:hypothetical protein
MSERRCRVCGCTDEQACLVEGLPCCWAEEDLCSACATPAELRRTEHGRKWLERLTQRLRKRLAGKKVSHV